MKEIIIKVDADTKDASKSVDNLGDSVEDTAQATQGLTNQLDKMTGGLITAFKGVLAGVKSTILGMRTLKGAIAATGIGALVVVVGTLVSHFTSTQRGADKVNQVFKTIGATIDVLTDRLSMFGEGLVQMLRGDFSLGLETLRGSFEDVTGEINRESAAALQLEKDFQALRDREIEFIKIQAEKRREIEKFRLAAEDESKSDQQRAESLRKSISIQNELTEEQIAFEKERARIIRERVALGESMADDIENQARAEARIIELETERDARLRSLQTRLNAFTKATNDNTDSLKKNEEAQMEALAKRALKEQDLADIGKIETKGAAGGDLTDEQKTKIKQNDFLNKKLAESNKRFAKEDTEIQKKKNEDQLSIEEKRAKAEENIRMSLLQLSMLMGDKASKEAKSIAVAQVLFDVYRGIQASFASNATNTAAVVGTGGAWPFVQAAAAAAFGFANLRQILKAPTKGASSGSASITTPSASSPAPAEIAPEITSFNEGVGLQQNSRFANVKAVVIQQDVTNAQSLAQVIQDQERV